MIRSYATLSRTLPNTYMINILQIARSKVPNERDDLIIVAAV